MRHSFTLFILLALTPLAQAAAQWAQRFPTMPLAPVLAHHEGRTFLATGGTLGGALGLSALVNIRPGDGPWAIAGTLTFTPTGAALGSIVGVIATQGQPIGVAVVGVGTGLLAGAAGHSVGLRAAAGSRGSQAAIHVMGVLAVPAAILVGMVYWALWDES